MRCRMIYNVRSVFGKYAVHSFGIPYRSNKSDKIESRIIMFKLLLNVIRIIFIYIKNNKLLRRMCGNLPAQLASYRTAAACNKNHLIAYILHNRLYIYLYRVTTEKVFYFNISQLIKRRFSIDQLIHSGKYFKFAFSMLTYIDKFTYRLFRRSRNSNYNLINIILLCCVQNTLASSDNPYAMNICVMF